MWMIPTADNGVYVATEIKVLDQYRSSSSSRNVSSCDWDKDPGQTQAEKNVSSSDDPGGTL